MVYIFELVPWLAESKGIILPELPRPPVPPRVLPDLEMKLAAAVKLELPCRVELHPAAFLGLACPGTLLDP